MARRGRSQRSNPSILRRKAGVIGKECVGTLSKWPYIGNQGGTADVLHLSLRSYAGTGAFLFASPDFSDKII